MASVLIASAIACIPILVWYVGSALLGWAWPVADGRFGVITGLIGFVIILSEILFWPRKALLRKFRWLGRARPWMWCHIVLGLVCVPIIVLHSGFDWGGRLSATTMVLFLVVIVSGVWGLVMQQWLPQKILNDIPSETVASQVEFAVEKHVSDAKRILDQMTTELGSAPDAKLGFKPKVIGRSKDQLSAFVKNLLVPYLQHGRKIRRHRDVHENDMMHAEESHAKLEDGKYIKLGSRKESENLFARLRMAIPNDALDDLTKLERLADIRRQWDTHVTLNFWLRNWLVIHGPLSLSMFVCMCIHAVKALKYW